MDFAILKKREKNIQFYLESCSEADKKKNHSQDVEKT